MTIDGELDEAIEKLERASKKLDAEDLDKSSEFVKRFEPSAFDQLGANRLQVSPLFPSNKVIIISICL